MSQAGSTWLVGMVPPAGPVAKANPLDGFTV